MEYSKQSQNIGKKSLAHFDSALKFCIYKGGIYFVYIRVEYLSVGKL